MKNETIYNEENLTIRYYEAIRERNGELCHDSYKFTNTKDINSDVFEIFQEGTPEAVYLTDKDGTHLDRVKGTMHMTPEGELTSVDVELENVEEVKESKVNDIISCYEDLLNEEGAEEFADRFEMVMDIFKNYKTFTEDQRKQFREGIPQSMSTFVNAMDRLINAEKEND